MSWYVCSCSRTDNFDQWKPALTKKDWFDKKKNELINESPVKQPETLQPAEQIPLIIESQPSRKSKVYQVW